MDKTLDENPDLEGLEDTLKVLCALNCAYPEFSHVSIIHLHILK